MKIISQIKNIILYGILLQAGTYAAEIEVGDYDIHVTDNPPEKFTLPPIKFARSSTNPGDFKNEAQDQILEFSVDPYSSFVAQVNSFLNIRETKEKLCPTTDPDTISLEMNKLVLYGSDIPGRFLFYIERPAKKNPENSDQKYFAPGLAPLEQDSLLELNQLFTNKYLEALHMKNPLFESVPLPMYTPEKKSEIIKKDLNGNIWNVFSDKVTVNDLCYTYTKKEIVNQYNRWISYSISKNIPPSQKTKSARNL